MLDQTGEDAMNYTDEKDYIMRMMKEVVSVLVTLALRKPYISVEQEQENKFRVSGRPLNDFCDMADKGKINEAENLLLEEIDYTSPEDVAAAALFYQHLSEMKEAFLQEHQYSKEEVVFGMKDLLEKSGYSDLFELLSDI